MNAINIINAIITVWGEAKVSPLLKQSTYDGYKRDIEYYIKPVHSGKGFDATAAGTDNGTLIK